jgi:hypothetical protein
VLATGCGGGGGGGGDAGTGGGTPAAVQITQANARPVGAHASDSVQNTNATQGSTGLITGVQVEGPAGGGSPATLLLAQVARSIARHGSAGALATGVAVSESVACDGGRGTISITGTLADENRLAAGDTLTTTASNCATFINGQGVTLDGAMSLTVTSGEVAEAFPFHVVMRVVATHLSITAGGVTTRSHGDLTLDWTASSSSTQTLVATGTSLTHGTTASGVSRSTTWKNFRQSVGIAAANVTSSLSAAVETDSARLGSSGGSYTISTPTALSWNTATGVPTAGVVLATGAANSQLRITFGAGGATLQVDANGDGNFEDTLNSTAAELRSFL